MPVEVPVSGTDPPIRGGRILDRVSAPADLPPLDWSVALTQWEIAPIPLVLTTWAVGFYLVGVRSLTRRGDAWPIGRTVAHLSGMALFYVVTASGFAAYDTTLLSVHMVQHMALSMVVPLVLALGAPVTLALRTLPGSGRRVLLAVLSSRVVKVLSAAPVAFALFALSPWVLYFSGWYPATLDNLYIHEVTHLHIVATGALFFWPMVGIDPVPGRVSYPARMLLVVLTLPFHAFLGLTIMGQTDLIGADHYLALRDGPMGEWLQSAAADQELAGGILWGSGDLVGIGIFVVLFAQWVRASMKEAAREDRRLDLLEARQARSADAESSVDALESSD